MKILVDEMPESPKACPFSEKRRVGPYDEIYCCTLRPYIEEAGGKPRCLCKRVETCDRLLPVNTWKEVTP